MTEAARRMATSTAGITHYEIYVYDRKRWTLQVRFRHDQKELALEEAKIIEKSLGLPVKVVRETYFPETNTCEEVTAYLSPKGNKPEVEQAQRDTVQTLRPAARVRRPEKPAAPPPRPARKASSSDSVGVLVVKVLAIIVLAMAVASTATELLSSILAAAEQRGHAFAASTRPRLVFGTFAISFLGVAVPLTLFFVGGAFRRKPQAVPAKPVRTPLETQARSPLDSQSRTAEAPPRPAAPAAPAPPAEPPERPGPWTLMMTSLISGLFSRFTPAEPSSAEPQPAPPANDAEPLLEDEAPTASAEPPSALPQLPPGEVVSIAKQRLNAMRFLGEALTRVKEVRPQLDTYNRFGFNLIIAGAVDALASANQVSDLGRRHLLHDAIGMLGVKGDMASAFCDKLDQYMLEPRYMRMVQFGRELMERFIGGEANSLEKLPAALDEWNKPAAKQPTQRIVTVLFTDMVGSTDLTQSKGDMVAQDLVRRHNSIVRIALAEYDGREIKHTGDGIMASFASTANAVDAVVLIQRAVADYNKGNPGLPLHLRIGVNAGEPIEEEDDLFGTTVQLAARICAKAETDQILCSNVVRELSAGKGRRFVSKGEHALKGFKDPVALHEILWQPIAEPPAAAEPPAEATAETAAADKPTEEKPA